MPPPGLKSETARIPGEYCTNWAANLFISLCFRHGAIWWLLLGRMLSSSQWAQSRLLCLSCICGWSRSWASSHSRLKRQREPGWMSLVERHSYSECRRSHVRKQKSPSTWPMMRKRLLRAQVAGMELAKALPQAAGLQQQSLIAVLWVSIEFVKISSRYANKQ